ncbi:MAG: cardiolipin synthase [Muribaculaceae bacterium]|nr:cardiolipin synthase [Muribaculaceae bacterium]
MTLDMILTTDWVTLIGVAIYLTIVVGCIIVVLSENRNPIRSIAWSIALLALPGIGLLFYLFFGRSLKGHHLISRHNKRKLLHCHATRSANLDTLPPGDPGRQIVKLAYSLTHSPLTVGNDIRIFTTGNEKFESLLADIKAARKSIYLQYYIFADDALGDTIADMLIRKASEGLKVCVIYDHVGSFSARNSFFRRMKDGGVEIHPFFRVTFPQLANRINWRNHRKIVIIDNRIGYIGGMNIAERYVKGMKDGSAWRDTHFRIEGDVVQSLIFSFAVDWYFLRIPDQKLDTFAADSTFDNDCPMQLVTSGPVDSWNNLSLCFLRAIASAKRSIFIQTPYFLPTDTLLNALEAAALANVDVRIMIPAKSDSRLLQLATYSYVTRCLKAGIKVYRYTPGMLHAKSMTVDDSFVTAGSTNFDFRSFENNFEANLLIYDKKVNATMRDIFFTDLRQCQKLRYSEWHSRPRLQRALESLVRLFAPIL